MHDLVNALAQKNFRPAIARKALWQGVIEIKVSTDAKETELETSDGVVHYWRFRKSLKGGSVCCYLHADEIDYGENVMQAIVFQRTHDDGSVHVHVDLRPEKGDAVHKLLFVSGRWAGSSHASWPHIAVPQVANGFIVIAPVDAKVSFGAPAKKSPSSDTSDPQLQRLQKEGWRIKEDKGATVVLSKMIGAREKEMIHNRPKPKVKKK